MYEVRLSGVPSGCSSSLWELISGRISSGFAAGVFARAGIGRVTLSAITDRDLPVVIAVIMLSAVVFVVVHLLVDLAYPLLDPRLRDRAGAR